MKTDRDDREAPVANGDEDTKGRYYHNKTGMLVCDRW